MRWIVLKKQLVLAVVLALAGLALLCLGWRGMPGGADKPAPAGTPVVGPAAKADTNTAGNKTALDPGTVQPVTKPDDSGESFFVEFRLNRERIRGEQLALLKEIVNNPATTGDTRQRAQERLLSISQNMTREMEVENLIRARGYRDAAVCLENGGATVVVEAGRFAATDAARIADLVTRNTGVGMQNVVIIPRS